MADVRIELNHEGMRELLRSPGVRSDLGRRAARVAAAAGPGHGYEVEIGRNRAFGRVWTQTAEAMRKEATSRNLTRAFDSARG